MRRCLLVMPVALLIAMQAMGQSVKKVKTEVHFKNLANYTTTETTRIEGEKKRADSQSEIKGHGVLKNALIKVFLKSGNTGEITDLKDMKIYDMDHGRKTYTVRDIKPFSTEGNMKADEDKMETKSQNDKEQRAEKDTTIKIIRREFKVEDTGEKKTINNFECNKYIILWVMEWENLNNKEYGTDSLFSSVWTTPVSGTLQKVNQDEMEFNSAYMKKMGFDIPAMQQDMMGLHWISIMNGMNNTDDNSTAGLSSEWKKLDKIKGMPVVVDGDYFAIRPEQESKVEKKEESKPKSVRGLFGRFAKKTIEKKLEAPKETGPDLHFYTEVMQYGQGNFSNEIFSVPSDYKKK